MAVTKRHRRPPPVSPVVRVHGDYMQQVMQQNIEDATQEARALPQRKGRAVTATIPVGTTKVAHGLGRKPIGWQVQSISALNVFREISRTTRFIEFEGTGAEAEVEFWFY